MAETAHHLQDHARAFGPDSHPTALENIAGRSSDALYRNQQTKASVSRVSSVDLLRGFAIFWILGADEIAWILKGMSSDKDAALATVGQFVGSQLEHAAWEGFRFYDLIFPLFIFVTGVALVFSLAKCDASGGKAVAYARIARRAFLLYVLGIIYYGGLVQEWSDIRFVGVLQRIAVCYLVASILFLSLTIRGLIAVFVGSLLGYWMLMALVPVPGIGAASYEPDLNLAHWIDRNYLPGRLWFTTWDPEGLVSTLPAVATCLMGVFAGVFMKDVRFSPSEKSVLLIGAGVLTVAAGYFWGGYFPIIKSIWTSSYVLVAGGYSLLLLGVAYQIADVWKIARWTSAFVWIGANAIALYMLNGAVNFSQLGAHLAGGDNVAFLEAYLTPAVGRLLACAGGLMLAILLARSLYHRKIFLRV